MEKAERQIIQGLAKMLRTSLAPDSQFDVPEMVKAVIEMLEDLAIDPDALGASKPREAPEEEWDGHVSGMATTIDAIWLSYFAHYVKKRFPKAFGTRPRAAIDAARDYAHEVERYFPSYGAEDYSKIESFEKCCNAYGDPPGPRSRNVSEETFKEQALKGVAILYRYYFGFAAQYTFRPQALVEVFFRDPEEMWRLSGREWELTTELLNTQEKIRALRDA